MRWKFWFGLRMGSVRLWFKWGQRRFRVGARDKPFRHLGRISRSIFIHAIRLTPRQFGVKRVSAIKPAHSGEAEPTDPMTKRDLVVRISEETGLVQQDVLNVVQKTLDYISNAVTTGQKVELRNFGVFEVKIRKARVGRNPNAPAADVPIPPRAVVKFKPGKDMREAVLKLTPQQLAEQQKLEAEAQKAGTDGESNLPPAASAA